jgi:PAS domain S-box-containing protein
MKTDLKILILEDEPFDVELNKAQLQLLDEYNCIVEWVTNKKDYLNSLNTFIPELILSDYSLPGYTGLDALLDLKARNLIIPFIFVTGTLNEETAADAIKNGAWDYVVKDRLFRLPLAIRSTLQLRKEKEILSKVEDLNRQLSMAVEQSPSHIMITDTNGHIEYVNARFTEVTGFSLEEAKGKTPRIFKSGFHDSKYYKSLWNTLKSGHQWRGEFCNLRKDGTIYWEHASISPLKNENGEITHFISIKEDITLRKRMDQEIIEARDKAERSDKLKEIFLQNLSHEIRTPLNAIVGFLSLIGETCSQNNCEKNKYIEYVTKGADQLTSIISDIIDLSQLDAKIIKLNEKKFNLVKLLNQLVESNLLKLESSNVNLHFNNNISESDTDAIVKSDEARVSQIINNLISNAIKFTSEGSITISTEKKENGIEIRVKDTGIGIAPENYHLIFQRFTQIEIDMSRRYGGLGIGLSLCKELAEILKMDIWFKSEFNKGSEFYLLIPFEKKKEEPVVLQAIVTKEISFNKVLVAEDDINNFIYINEIIKVISGLESLHAWDGQEAIELVNSNPDIDIVFMDIRMPVLDGVAALLEIKKQYPKIPVIAVTAYAFDSERNSLMSNGFDGYLSKPFHKNDLNEIMLKFSINKTES